MLAVIKYHLMSNSFFSLCVFPTLKTHLIFDFFSLNAFSSSWNNGTSPRESFKTNTASVHVLTQRHSKWFWILCVTLQWNRNFFFCYYSFIHKLCRQMHLNALHIVTESSFITGFFKGNISDNSPVCSCWCRWSHFLLTCM